MIGDINDSTIVFQDTDCCSTVPVKTIEVKNLCLLILNNVLCRIKADQIVQISVGNEKSNLAVNIEALFSSKPSVLLMHKLDPMCGMKLAKTFNCQTEESFWRIFGGKNPPQDYRKERF